MMHMVVCYQGAGTPSNTKTTAVTKYLAVSDNAISKLVCIRGSEAIIRDNAVFDEVITEVDPITRTG